MRERWEPLGLRELLAKGEQVVEREGLTFGPVAVNPGLGAAVVGRWGKRLDGASLGEEIERHLDAIGASGFGENHAGTTGFAQSWWTEGVSLDELFPLQVEVSRQSLRRTTRALGIEPHELSRIGVGSTTPASTRLAELVGAAVGSSPAVRTEVAAAACNSAALLFDHFLKEGAQSDSWQAIIGIETLMALRRPLVERSKAAPADVVYSHGIQDRVAMSFFSDSVAAVVLRPSRFRVIARTSLAQKDVKEALCGVTTVPLEGAPLPGYDGLIRQSEWGLVSWVPAPPDGQAISMNPLGTTRLFLTFLRNLVSRFRSVYEKQVGEQFDPGSVDWVLVHHPSEPIHGKLRQILGFSAEQMPWNSGHLNAPACTFGMEMARVLPGLRTGDRICSVFFGAGVTGQIQLLEIV